MSLSFVVTRTGEQYTRHSSSLLQDDSSHVYERVDGTKWRLMEASGHERSPWMSFSWKILVVVPKCQAGGFICSVVSGQLRVRKFHISWSWGATLLPRITEGFWSSIREDNYL